MPRRRAIPPVRRWLVSFKLAGQAPIRRYVNAPSRTLASLNARAEIDDVAPAVWAHAEITITPAKGAAPCR